MNYWVFKCNPKLYDLAKRLRNPATEMSWFVTRYKNEIQPGDVAFLMETGPNRCIRATMSIDTTPSEMAELEGEQEFWESRDTELRCRVRGEITNRFELPISELQMVDGLQGLSILKGFQQGTNFRVTEDEARIILRLVDDSCDRM